MELYKGYSQLYPVYTGPHNEEEMRKHEKQAIANRARTIGHYWDEDIYQEFKDTAKELGKIWEALESVCGEWLSEHDLPEIDMAMLAVHRMQKAIELAAEQMEPATKFDLYQELDDVA